MRVRKLAALVGLLCASSLGMQSLWAATPTPAATTTTRTTTTRVDVKTTDTTKVTTPKKDTTVNGHHVRVRARQDHSVNRFAGRNAGARPITTHDINARLGLPPESKDDDDREHIMLVHGEDSARSVDDGKDSDKSQSSTSDRRDDDDRTQRVKTSQSEREEQREEKKDERVSWRNANRAETRKEHAAHHGHKYESMGTIGAFDGANGDGGGGGESVGALNSTNSNDFGGIKEINLGQGSALIAHRQHVIVNTQHGKLHVLPHSAAFVTQIGRTVSVYNLGDAKEGAINFKLQGRELSVPVGSELLLTRDPHQKFDDVNPVKGITTRNAASLGSHGDIKMYQAEYSPVSALDRIPQFSKLVLSKNPDDQKLANRLIKTASVLLQCEQPFAEEKPPEPNPVVGSK